MTIQVSLASPSITFASDMTILAAVSGNLWVDAQGVPAMVELRLADSSTLLVPWGRIHALSVPPG